MVGFTGRKRQHDEVAVPVVMEMFKSYGFECFVMGTESDNDFLRQALMAQSDRTSIMLRFRPDRVFIRRGMRTILCEVKSEGNGSPNFAVEIDSYQASHEWNTLYNHVMYAFVDLSGKTNSLSCCWCNDIPRPRLIFVPRRWDFGETYMRLQREWPNAELRPIENKSGSGTAFFLVPKNAPYFLTFHQFAQTQILPCLQQLEMTLA